MVTVTADAGVVLDIWQQLVNTTLCADSANRFRNHPDLTALTRYPEHRLRAAGAHLYQREGRLLLTEWARECAWEGGGSAVLDWTRLAVGDPEAQTVARDLLAAAVASVQRERDRIVLAQRLGLDGDAAMTLPEIGQRLQLTRERVRQLQDRAIEEMCRRHSPPWASNYVGRILAGAVSQAVDDNLEPAAAFLTLAEAACPGTPTAFGVQVLARLAGHSRRASEHLAAEVATLLSVHQAGLARETRTVRVTERAAERLGRMLPLAEWPGGQAPAPPNTAIRPQRQANADGAPMWHSAKLARAVSYDSVAELSLIRLLDRAPQVSWFCEQPVAIGYHFAGRHRTYYPDLLVVTGEGRCVLIEVKPLPDMPLAINQAKAAAARAFCARHGWGFLLTDVGGRTPRNLLTLPVPGQAAQGFAAALHRSGSMTWRDVKKQREQHGLTSLQVSALALQRGWDVRLNPYRISEAAAAQRATA